IAIIAILAAILFPVFAQARSKARQASCLSNMKQIGTGLMMYTQDYDEVLPGVDPSNGHAAGYGRDLGWNEPFKPAVPATYRNGPRDVHPSLKNTGVYKCPETSPLPRFNGGNPPYNECNKGQFPDCYDTSYAINGIVETKALAAIPAP